MPHTRPAYPSEVRLRILGLVRAGRSVPGLARESEPTETASPNWITPADRDAGLLSNGLTIDERDWASTFERRRDASH